MRVSTTRSAAIRATSAFAIALALAGQTASAQDVAADESGEGDAIVVTGIRASLSKAMDIKRTAQG
ncbi:MAG: hypothetical protein VW891_06610, partial [Novosphingobium sp.]